MSTGRVASWTKNKAIGEIQDDTGRRFFVHVSGLKFVLPRGGALEVGQRVTFQLRPNPRRPGSDMAINVELEDGESVDTNNGPDPAGGP